MKAPLICGIGLLCLAGCEQKTGDHGAQETPDEGSTRPAHPSEEEVIQAFSEFQADTKKFAQRINEISARYAHALNFERIQIKGDYANTRKIVNEYAQINKEAVKFIEGRSSALSKKLDEIKLFGDERVELERAFNSNHQPSLPFIKRIRECDIKGCEPMLNILDLLEKAHGHWTWNPSTGVFDFEDDSLAKPLNKEQLIFNNLMREQLEWKRKMARQGP